jgi:hypothetical protein
MMTYILALLGLPLLCVLWIVFQGWLAKNNPDYKGYKAGCGGCSRRCEETEPDCGHTETGSEKIPETHYVDASSLSGSLTGKHNH